MIAPRLQRKPRLVWLSRLLLLVIAGLGVMGLALLKQDRRQATQDAEILAQALADSLARESARQISEAIQRYVQGAEAARDSLGRAAMALPADTNVASLPAQFPLVTLDAIPRAQFYVMEKGGYPLLEIPEAPQPPDWVLSTPRSLLTSWEAMELEAHQSGKMPATVAQFQENLASADCRALELNLRLLSALMAEGQNDEKAMRLRSLSVGWAWADTMPSGVQIGDVACYQAIRLAESESVIGELLTHLVSVGFRHPSFMTDRLLDALVERVRERAPALSSRAQAAQTLWRMDQRSRPILKIWQEQNRRRALLVRDETGTEYFVFAIASPAIGTNVTINHQFDTAVTNVVASMNHMIAIVPASVVDAAARAAANAVAGRWPAYLSAELTMLGARFGVTPGALGVTHRWDSQPLLVTRPETFVGPTANGSFELVVRLADPDLLLAKQRQRLLFFATLLVLATVVAAIGAWQLQRNLDAQLQLNEQKSNFVSSVSHELRAPIASVRLLAESLERGKISEPAKQNEYFRFIGQECRRLSSLIENVLDFSRIEQGRKQYEFEPTDVGALVEQTVKLMQPYAAERGVRLELKTNCQGNGGQGNEGIKPEIPLPHSSDLHSPDLVGFWELAVDGRAIQQALVNLIDNAIKHSPRDAVVTVAAEVSGATDQVSGGKSANNLIPRTSYLALSVTDHGPGIPAPEHEKIFERFYRLGSELRRETQGVGIGLSIVKHIVEAHGGRVRVESEVGQGSRFTIELPLLRQPNDE